MSENVTLAYRCDQALQLRRGTPHVNPRYRSQVMFINAVFIGPGR